jgi:hypothetical protein
LLKRIEQPGCRWIAGVFPFEKPRNAEFIANEVPGVHVPDALMERMRRADGPGEPRAPRVRIARKSRAACAVRCRVQVSTAAGNIDAALASSMDFADATGVIVAHPSPGTGACSSVQVVIVTRLIREATRWRYSKSPRRGANEEVRDPRVRRCHPRLSVDGGRKDLSPTSTKSCASVTTYTFGPTLHPDAQDSALQGIRHRRRVLEVGMGTGINAASTPRLRVTGIDLSTPISRRRATGLRAKGCATSA